MFCYKNFPDGCGVAGYKAVRFHVGADVSKKSVAAGCKVGLYMVPSEATSCLRKNWI